MRSVRRIAGMGAAGVMAAAGLCLAPGCGGSRQAAAPINTGLDRLAAGDPEGEPVALPDPLAMSPAQAELARLAEESAANLQAVFDQMNQRAPAREPTHPEPAAVAVADPGAAAARDQAQVEAAREELAARSPQPSPFEDPAVVEAPPAAVAEASPEADPSPTSAPAPGRTLEERIREHTIILVDLLRQQSLASAAPFRAYLGLAAMEAIWPGAIQQVITPDAGGGGSGGEGASLRADQIDAVEAFREIASGAGALTDETEAPADHLIELAERVIASRPMRIRNPALCSRVSGFGQFTPLVNSRFLHGRSQPVIIYTEVAPFAHRPATESEAARAAGSVALESGHLFWTVELSQEVQVFTDADGLLVWSRPEQRVLETSRNRRRDFFLVNEITLPRTLSVGRYQMKVIMRDKTSGAVDEAILPFEVVADPALARGAAEER